MAPEAPLSLPAGSFGAVVLIRLSLSSPVVPWPGIPPGVGGWGGDFYSLLVRCPGLSALTQPGRVFTNNSLCLHCIKLSLSYLRPHFGLEGAEGGGCCVDLICGDEGEGVQEENSSEVLTGGESFAPLRSLASSLMFRLLTHRPNFFRIFWTFSAAVFGIVSLARWTLNCRNNYSIGRFRKNMPRQRPCYYVGLCLQSPLS